MPGGAIIIPTPSQLGLSSDGRTLTVNGKTAKVCTDFHYKEITQGVVRRKLKFEMPWDDSDAFMDGLMGLGVSAPSGGSAIAFPVPHRFPGNPTLYCRWVTCDDNGGPAQPDPVKVLKYDTAIVTATYESTQWDVQGEHPERFIDGVARPWAMVETRRYSEDVPIKGDQLKYKNYPDVIPENSISASMPIIEIHYHRTYLPDIGAWLEAVSPCDGLLNSAEFWGFDVGRVMCVIMDTQPETNPDGSVYFQGGAVYKVRMVDWNAAVVSGTTNFDVLEDDQGRTAMAYGDISTPLTFGY